MTPTCWFAHTFPDAGPCAGRLVRCHLIKRQVLVREGKTAAMRGGMGRIDAAEWAAGLPGDSRSWVPGCGGAMGPGGHHGRFAPDGPRPIPRRLLPPGLIEFADELGLGWYIEHVYGPLEMAA